jgi:hypothetical protein
MDAQDSAGNGPGASARRSGKAHATLIATNAGDHDGKDDQDGPGKS